MAASCWRASSSTRPPAAPPRRTPAACTGTSTSPRRSSPGLRCCFSTSRLALWETIEELVGEGTTVLLTTQYLDEADRLADTIAVIDQGRVIAEGTPDELKDRVGGERLEVRLADAAAAPRAVAALAEMSDEPPATDGALVTLTVRTRTGAIVQAVRRLDDAGVDVDDLALRRPTLDDVFLALTGHAAEIADGGDDEGAAA